MITAELPVIAGRPRDAMDREFRRNIGLVEYVVRRWYSDKTGQDDARQIGRLALWTACQRYDKIHGVTISTYAIKWIYWTLRRYYDRPADFRLDVACSTDDPLPGSEDTCLADVLTDPESGAGYDGVLNRDVVTDLISVCNERQQHILHELYFNERMLGEVAAPLGITGERVRQIHVSALAAIRSSGKLAA